MPVNLKIKDDIQHAWSLLQLTNNSVMICAEAALYKKKIKLTPQQFSVLAAIKHIGDPVLANDVALWLDRQPNTITLMIDRMEVEGLVSRVRDLKDRRAIRLVVSPLGQKLYLSAIKPSHEVARSILSVLTPADLDSLNLIMDKIRQKSFQYRKVEDQVLDENDIKKNRPELKVTVKNNR